MWTFRILRLWNKFSNSMRLMRSCTLQDIRLWGKLFSSRSSIIEETLTVYPCLKERPDVLEVLKKSDRKMKYMEVDLKSEQRRKNTENGAESYVPSKEDSLERLVYSAKCQFADDAEGVEDAVIRKDDLCRLRAALDQFSEEERFLIHALFFDERSERELEEMMGVHRMTIHNRKIRILQKLKKMLR